jgi:NADH:ubiquinone oxidoreductase subunit 5 (subunit L)/multisubunit Na+/H+ antiporter MnhA subunit
MFLALGVQAWDAAIFHLMTHAFFKALLFLSSGSVILAAIPYFVSRGLVCWPQCCSPLSKASPLK